MDIKGTVIQIFPTQTGQGKKGQWQKQEFLLETQGQYPKKICMSLWGHEKIDNADLEEGMTLTAHIELESREYNGRYYTEVRCWKIEGSSRSGINSSKVADEPFATSQESQSGSDDLPF